MQAKRKGCIDRMKTQTLVDRKNVALKMLHVDFKQKTWPSSQDFGIYRINEQRRLRRVCAYAQTPQSLRCSCIKSMDVDKGSDQNHRPLAPLGTASRAFVRGTGACIMFLRKNILSCRNNI